MQTAFIIYTTERQGAHHGRASQMPSSSSSLSPPPRAAAAAPAAGNGNGNARAGVAPIKPPFLLTMVNNFLHLPYVYDLSWCVRFLNACLPACLPACTSEPRPLTHPPNAPPALAFERRHHACQTPPGCVVLHATQRRGFNPPRSNSLHHQLQSNPLPPLPTHYSKNQKQNRYAIWGGYLLMLPLLNIAGLWAMFVYELCSGKLCTSQRFAGPEVWCRSGAEWKGMCGAVVVTEGGGAGEGPVMHVDWNRSCGLV